ncbi:MAG: hypothetical protein V3S41_08720 [Spirochaetia bacterium]
MATRITVVGTGYVGLIQAAGTPEASDGSADLSQIQSVAADIVAHARKLTVVVTKSTVPVGTNRWIAEELGTRSGDPAQFVVVSNPEFLREGRAVQDFFHPDRIVVGFDDPDSQGAPRPRLRRELFSQGHEGCCLHQ